MSDTARPTTGGSSAFGRADVESLAAKLDDLDLTPAERAGLVAVIGGAREATGDVAGFAYDLNPNDVSIKGLLDYDWIATAHSRLPGTRRPGR